jgi:hypothetical protein
MSDLNLSILGFAAVNRDLTVELRDPVTQEVVKKVRPFLDGSLHVTGLPPGAYDVAVFHPNLALPIVRRPIRVLPVGDTKVSVLIDPSQFKNTPIDNIPEANLAPILDIAKSIGETVAPLAGKAAGEAIRSADWNAMAGAIRDLAGAVGELTRLVSPRGHDHPELVKKIDEVTGNFQQLVESVTASLTELQREIQIQRFDGQVKNLLGVAQIDPATPRGKEITDLVATLQSSSTASPAVFSRDARNAAVQLQTKVETLINEKPALATNPAVTALANTTDLLKNQRATTYQAELDQHRLADRQLGPAFQSLSFRG